MKRNKLVRLERTRVYIGEKSVKNVRINIDHWIVLGKM